MKYQNFAINTTAIGTPGLYLTQTSSSGDIIACDMTPTFGVFSGLTSSYVSCYRASPTANSSLHFHHYCPNHFSF